MPHYIIGLLLILVRSMATLVLVLALLLMLLEFAFRSESLSTVFTLMLLLRHVVHLLFVISIMISSITTALLFFLFIFFVASGFHSGGGDFSLGPLSDLLSSFLLFLRCRLKKPALLLITQRLSISADASITGYFVVLDPLSGRDNC